MFSTEAILFLGWIIKAYLYIWVYAVHTDTFIRDHPKSICFQYCLASSIKAEKGKAFPILCCFTAAYRSQSNLSSLLYWGCSISSLFLSNVHCSHHTFTCQWSQQERKMKIFVWKTEILVPSKIFPLGRRWCTFLNFPTPDSMSMSVTLRECFSVTLISWNSKRTELFSFVS